jgi:subfamily B ATP-binding cassette protein MsbA
MIAAIRMMLQRQFSTLYFFFSHLRYKILIALGFSLFVGVLDGLSLSMFLPLLQMVGGNKEVDPDLMGNLQFLLNIMNSIRVDINLITVLTIMLLFFLMKGIIVYISNAYKVRLLQFFVIKIRVRLLESLNSMKYKAFVTSDAGRIQNTMSGEVERISQAYNLYIESIQQGILVFVYIGFAFFIDYQFAILVSVGGVSTNLAVGFLYRKTKTASQQYTKDSNNYQGLIIQHVANYKYLRATGYIQTFEKRLKKAINEIEYSRKKMGIVNAVMMAIREPLLISTVVIVILIQTSVLGGSLGGILVSLLFFYRALTAVNQMQNSWNRYISNTGSLENIQELQKVFDNAREDSKLKNANQMIGDLELINGCFFYGESMILSDINLKIKNKESVAFIGESGSGKTTLINILTGLMPLDKGDFLINGNSSSTIDLRTYQKRIGYITQDPVIFNDSIFNNVTLWADNTDENKIRFQQAIINASIHEFVTSLKQGENTQLGNNGINLSGGQKQRISIARELYKDIDILIMDEATSALDSQTERNIQENIDALKGKYTLIIVAHRLSTIRNVDTIILMDKGKIAGTGNFDDLANHFPQFKRMLELQEL